MGGRAFLEVLPNAAFPRMPHQLYQMLKTKHLEQLTKLFLKVGVPREAPGKQSHGDLDFIVFSPVDGDRPDDIKNALCATHCIAGPGILNLAIPTDSGDASIFYQVDINKCRDEDEWERMMFFHGYGDLGMIMGLVARANGLSLGLNGLKIPHSPELGLGPYLLSTSFPKIFTFFGLDTAPWEAGFPSLLAIFQWVASSRLFDPRIVKESPHREHRRGDRDMYQQFLAWVRGQRSLALRGSNREPRQARPDKVVEEAKLFFSKKQEYEDLVATERMRRKLKHNFNGHLVMEWTGLHGLSVRKLMNEVRAKVDDPTIQGLTQEEMKARVLKVQETMALYPEVEPKKK